MQFLNVLAPTIKHLSARVIGFGFLLLLCGSRAANAQFWTPVPGYPGQLGASTALLRTDGAVMIQDQNASCDFTSAWYLLVPDAFGNYKTGHWFRMKNFPHHYAPIDGYASAVLPDGRVVVAGGEANDGCVSALLSTGFILPFSFPDSDLGRSESWQPLQAPFPSGYAHGGIGDAPSVVLPDGTWMVANSLHSQSVILDPATLTWSPPVSKGKIDANEEEGWTLLPNGDVLSISVDALAGSKGHDNAQVYNYKTKEWTSIRRTPVQLSFLCSPGQRYGEIGPAVLLPDGKVFAVGATSNTALYDTATGVWTPGPVFPTNSYNFHQENGVADGPAALMPNGHVLVMASPVSANGVDVCNEPGADFFEFDGTKLNSVPWPPNAANENSSWGRMLVLPSGHILFTDGTKDVEIYTPAGTYKSAWRPRIRSVDDQNPFHFLSRGNTYTVTGYQFTGLSQGAMYGDDAQTATNFPLVRITNFHTGHVIYAPTVNDCSGDLCGVATGNKLATARFYVPESTETGDCFLEVVVNGIPSDGWSCIMF